MKRSQFSSKRRKPAFQRRTASGAPPGMLCSDPGAHPTSMRVMAYGPGDLIEQPIGRADELRAIMGKYPVLWLDVAGLRDASTIGRIGEIFKLHSLALEDVVNVHQRPKVDEYGNCQFIVARMAPLHDGEATEQMSIFLGSNFVVTFQEALGDCLEPVRNRIRADKGQIRHAGCDHLAYAILDAIVDAYFPLIEGYGEKLDDIEDQAVERPQRRLLLDIYTIRRKILMLRRAMWPLREAVGHLQRQESPNVTQETRIFLRDLSDHTVQIIDMLETYRDLSLGLMDVYISSVGNRMNEIMKLLTIITTVFIPLTFLAGLYGMNYHTDVSAWNMPELTWKYGYLMCLCLMLFIALGQLWLFWKKGWFTNTWSAAKDGDRAETDAAEKTP
ncbi:MAG: magnesium/cobalt transporter CorA [bacterium]|nr:magnesium/cobalt transporter CorA [Candidatus Sumerlaeota bacterium]